MLQIKVHLNLSCMSSNIKVMNQAIEVINDSDKITLNIDKKQIFTVIRGVLSAALFLVLVVFTIISYQAESYLFQPLAVSTGILSLIALVAIKSNHSKA